LLPSEAVDALGILGTICFALMLSPQVYLNCSKRSTEGLSLALIVLWHVAALLPAAYYAAGDSDDTFGILSLMTLAFFCGVVEAQFVAFRLRGPEDIVGVLLSAVVVGLTVVSAVSYVVLVELMKQLPEGATFAIGNIIPSILLCVSFFPQIYEFVHRWSFKGYSFGVTFFDVCGCSANTVLILNKPGLSVGDKIAHAAPFVSIIVMHFFLVILAMIICSSGRRKVTEIEVIQSDAKP